MANFRKNRFGVLTSIGKTEARNNFLPLVNSIDEHSSVVEITDRDKPVAMLVSHGFWLSLMAKLDKLEKQGLVENSMNQIGSVKILSDLEAGSADQL